MGIRVELEEFISQHLREYYGLPVHWTDNSAKENSRRPRSRRSKLNASQKCNSAKSPIVIDNAHDGEVDNNLEVTLISRDGPTLQSPTKSNTTGAHSIKSSTAYDKPVQKPCRILQSSKGDLKPSLQRLIPKILQMLILLCKICHRFAFLRILHHLWVHCLSWPRWILNWKSVSWSSPNPSRSLPRSSTTEPNTVDED